MPFELTTVLLSRSTARLPLTLSPALGTMSRRALCSFSATLPRGVARKMSALPQEGSCSHWCFIAAGVALSYWHGAQSMPAVCSLPGTRRKYCSASDNAGSRWRRFVVISANRGACGTVDGQANPRGCEGQKQAAFEVLARGLFAESGKLLRPRISRETK